jgi:AraC-like DNA-binding protein
VRYREYWPDVRLRAYVDRYWSLEGTVPGEHIILPDGHAEWVVHLGEPFAGQSSCLCVGQMSAPVRLQAQSPIRAFGIRFLPEGAAAFCQNRQTELTNRIVDLGSIAAIGSWPDAIAEGDAVRRTDMLLLNLSRQRAPDPRVGHSARLLTGGATVDAASRGVGWSPRQMERAFAEVVGLTPKMFSRIARFQRAIRMSRSAGWADVAASCGYSDQSHLVRDFHEFAGAAPTQLLATEVTEALVR